MTVAEVRERVQAGGLLTDATGVVAMLSGGRDSVCLLDVAVALRGAARVRALHVNYRLRVDSDEDEFHCRELCEQLGVEIEILHAHRASDVTGNLHAWARKLRYEAAFDLAERLDEQARLGPPSGPEPVHPPSGSEPVSPPSESEPARPPSGSEPVRPPSEFEPVPPPPGSEPVRPQVVATGHTASDQVETILYRLAASPGRRALLGMPACDGRLVRPLLWLTREQTADYCRERGLRWREDASNENERFARSRVRHRLVSALDAVHPAARANVLRTAELLREETELLDALVDAELAGRASIAIDRLSGLPHALQRLVVIRLAERAAGTFVPQAGERVAEILALGARGGRSELHVGGLAGAVIEDGELRMTPLQPRPQHDGQ